MTVVPDVPARVLTADVLRDRIVVRGKHAAWKAAGLDPRDYLRADERGAVAREFARRLDAFCATAVERIEFSDGS